MASSKEKSKHKGHKHKGHKHEPKEGSGKDCCAIFGRILLFLAGILAVIFSLLVLSSCDFIEFAATNATDPNELEGAVLIEFSFGMFRYDANDTGCRSFDDNDILVDWPIWTGRGSTAVALLCAAAACLLMLVEFVCCRFKFSRCLMTTLFSFAIFGMALAFIMFASDVCTYENSQGKRYPCKAGTGSWYAVVAIGLYFITSISSCFAPRPKPMVQRLHEDKDDENDPCICCGGGGKKKDKHDDDEESKDEETPEPAPAPQQPPPVQEPPPVQQDAAPVVVAAAAAPVATQILPQARASTQKSIKAAPAPTQPPAQTVFVPTQIAPQTAPVPQVVTDEDNESQVSSIVHPSGVSAVTVPTTYGDISLYDGDMFFETDVANSV